MMMYRVRVRVSVILVFGELFLFCTKTFFNFFIAVDSDIIGIWPFQASHSSGCIDTVFIDD